MTDNILIEVLQSKVHGITEKPSEDETELILEISFVGKRIGFRKMDELTKYLENLIEEDKEMQDKFLSSLNEKYEKSIDKNT